MEDNLTPAERRKQKREETKAQRSLERAKEKKNSAFGKIAFGIGVFAVICIAGFIGYSKMADAKSVDEFAQCLKDKGIVIYGNNWCKHTQHQMNIFGPAFSRVNYVVCDENKGMCDQKKITITPTWEINGTMIQEVQSLESLSKLSGCELG